MYEDINEQVSVLVVFGQGDRKVRPFRIRWGDRTFEITEVGYQYKYKEGQSVIHVFSATDGTNFFELKYDSEDLKWMLGRVADNEMQ